jgi:hypothetical protein
MKSKVKVLYLKTDYNGKFCNAEFVDEYIEFDNKVYKTTEKSKPVSIEMEGILGKLLGAHYNLFIVHNDCLFPFEFEKTPVSPYIFRNVMEQRGLRTLLKPVRKKIGNGVNIIMIAVFIAIVFIVVQFSPQIRAYLGI